MLNESATRPATPAASGPRKGCARHDRAVAAYFRITPRRIQAWREENELAGRDLMRDGCWLA